MIDQKNYESSRQFLAGLILFVILLMLGLALTLYEPLIAFYWFTGIFFGYVLERSRFCFVAALRDPVLTGSSALTRGVLLALGLTTIIFALVKYYFFMTGQEIPGQNYILPIGLNTVMGGLLFGIGMVIASGCASGMLMRIGEGFQIHLITMVFFFVGTLFGNMHLEWWNTHFVFLKEGIFLPAHLGWFWGLFLQVLVIVLLYRLALKWEKDHEI